ncbi:hypothetical protein CI610_03714 [invertebrate metagenome]|uniref:Uncharacterized protein n=1 Tax=invertebrate metagenome TaxID=1711999 RepID=A0A2H9T2C9_9ZZZZ
MELSALDLQGISYLFIFFSSTISILLYDQKTSIWI